MNATRTERGRQAVVHWLPVGLPMLCALALALLLAACASAGARGSATPAASPTITHAPLPTNTPAPTAVAITDLGQFRQKLSDAYASGKWERVAPLLSPAFSFQGLNSGGAHLEMPQSAVDFKATYAAVNGWSQSQRPVDILWCDAGDTPQNQQIGFAGNDGSYVLLGLARWQGYWVVQWAYQDPIGESGACAQG
jgi:hypothetical protein